MLRIATGPVLRRRSNGSGTFVRLATLSISIVAAGCATTTSTTSAGKSAAAQPSQTQEDGTTKPSKPAGVDPSLRERWLTMFARGYYPGRSGQIFVVPKEGEVITERDPLYMFMHGSPWDYDTRIPFLLHGAPFIRQGSWNDRVSQQDLAPTVGALIGAPESPSYTGRVLSTALMKDAGKPRIVAVIVLDAMRADYFERFADVMPTLTRLRREGAWYSGARVTNLPTVTGVGHATIGTGTDPRIHGITVNNLFNVVTGKAQPAYDALDPRELMTLTLADTWNIVTRGKAIIIGQGGAIRATAGLVGHGACVVNGHKVIAASYNAGDAGWETNPACYTMSNALKAFNGRKVWEAAGGKWMGHDITSPTKFRASSLFQRFESEALLAVVNEQPIGEDDVTDLVMVNMKGPDYTGHAYGPFSPEIKETLTELDRQMKTLVETIERKAGAGRSVIAITADHGMPPEPPPGHRHYPEDIAVLVNQRFDPAGKTLVQYYGDSANNQLYIDTPRLQSLGHSLKDVAAFLESQEMFAAAFTEDEVWAAQSRLPMR